MTKIWQNMKKSLVQLAFNPFLHSTTNAKLDVKVQYFFVSDHTDSTTYFIGTNAQKFFLMSLSKQRAKTKISANSIL